MKLSGSGTSIPKPVSAKLKLFISYSRRDQDFADRLVSALEARGFEVLIDRRDLPALEDWKRELLGFIRQADTVVFVTSRNSLASEVCAWEVDQVSHLSKRLAPVLIEDIGGLEVPPQIARINYMFFTGDRLNGAGFEETADALASALMTDVGWIKEHTRLGEIARRWSERNFQSALMLRGRELTEAQAWISSHPRSAPEPTDLHRLLIAKSQEFAKRRQRMVVAASLAVSLVTSGLAVFAYVQMRERTALLSKTVQAATEMVASAAAIKDQVGVPSQVILQMLEVPDRSLAAIADQTRDIPDVIRAFVQLDYDICVMAVQAGDFTKGIGRCDQGIRRLAKLAELETPTVPDLQQLDSLLRMAAAGSQEGGKPDRAEQYRAERQKVIALLPQEQTRETSQVLDEVHSLADQAYADVTDREKLPTVLTSLDKARSLLKPLLDAAPDDDDLQLQMSLIDNRLIEALLLLSQPGDALPVAHDSVERMDRLAKKRPDDIEILRHQAHALDGWSRAALSTKAIAESRDAIARLKELSTRLSALDSQRVDLTVFQPVAGMREGALAKLEGKDDAFRPLLTAHGQFMTIYTKAKQASVRLLLLENSGEILADLRSPSAEAFSVLQDALEVELGGLLEGQFANDAVDGLRICADALYHRFKDNRVRDNIIAAALTLSQSAPCTASGEILRVEACLSAGDILRNQRGNEAAIPAYKSVLGGLGKAAPEVSGSAMALLIRGIVTERLCQIGVETIVAKKPAIPGAEQYCQLSAEAAAALYKLEPEPVRLEEQANRYNKGGLACLFQDKFECADANFRKGWDAASGLFRLDTNYDTPAVDALLRMVSARCSIASKKGKVDRAYNLRVVSELQTVALNRTVDKLAKNALAEATVACPYR